MPYEIKNFISAKQVKQLKNYVPTLFIGIGGTGKDVIMRLRKALYDKDGPGRRPYLRYLMLDTDKGKWWPSGTSQEEYEPVSPQPGEFLNCQINKQQFLNVFELLERQRDPRFVGWLKPELRNLGPSSVANGAGTHRQFGRMAFMLNYEQIRKSIQNALRGMQDEVGRLDAEATAGTKIETNSIEVVIITSLAGGTGSGMFLDTCYLVQDVLRSIPSLSNLANKYVSLIAVMPPAFEKVAEGRIYRKFQQNAYGSLLELEHYGTRRTGDDMFLGQGREEKTDRNRVGFVAPWKGEGFIEGQGWEVCYLIDNVNPHNLGTPMSLSETYQMIADYLFLDFEQSAFAIQKRSNRCNLSQYQNDMIGAWVRNPTITDSGVTDLQKNVDVVFATRNGCSFSSFGLSEISFSRERVYRAAGYLLASRLVLDRWLGSKDDYEKSDYQRWVSEDFYGDTGGDLSFHPDALLPRLYKGDKSNYYQDGLTDSKNLENIPYTEGSAKLRAVQAKHQARLQSSPQPGQAYQTLCENAKKLTDTTRSLPILHRRLLEAARRRADQKGVAPTRRLLDYYRGTAQSVAATVGKAPEGGGDGLLRLKEADTVWPPAQKMAQRIEFDRACKATRALILGSYRAKAAPLIGKDMRKIIDFIGEKSQDKPPAELKKYGTLYDYFNRSEKQLRKLGERLRKRFDDYRQEEGTDRSQLLSPDTWTDEVYAEQMDRCLEANPDIGVSDSGRGFNWDRFEEHFFAQLRENHRHEFDESFNSLTALLDRWFERYQIDEEAIALVAEMLAGACRNVLAQVELDLSAYHDGCVIDLLQIEYTPDERSNRLNKFIRASTPYMSMNLHDKAVMTNNYQPQFDNLIGLQAGDIPQRSKQNEQSLLTRINGLAQEAEAGMSAMSPLNGDRSSMVLCREVWGVPLQYYEFLDDLHEAYMERIEDLDECHINSYECWEDLPDVRALSPEIYEHLSANVETALFSMIIGTITCRQDGRYIVGIPNRVTNVGKNVYKLGKRINRIIKKVCEEEDIRTYLQTNQETWEQNAKPKQLALVYASCLWAYEFTQKEYLAGPDSDLSPLRNCAASLLKRFERRLSVNDEGLLWKDYFTCTESSDGAAEKQWRDLFKDLIENKKVLFRASEAVPIWEVDWTKIDQVQLPEGSQDSQTLPIKKQGE